MVLLAVAMLVAAAPHDASAHPERPTTFARGEEDFPPVRRSGPYRVVCKSDSRRRIKRIKGSKKNRRIRRRNLRYLKRCRYRHIQEAVNAARNGDRILVLPGVYREEPSREAPNPDPKCKDDYVEANGKAGFMVPSYRYELRCPNSRNLIAILGDSNNDGSCDSKCNIQIHGTGRYASQVQVHGDTRKQNVFKADRADGIVFYNMTAQYSDYNNFYVLETDGFRYEKIVSRWSREYGFLSFVSDDGVYQNLDAYGSGDAGVYPGSGPQTGGKRCGIVLTKVNSHDNLQGNSGSAGDGLCYHDNDFHHNGVGVVVDSFSTGHPGTPQDSSRWENNRIYSNNRDYFTADRDRYCLKPYVERDPKIVCPAIMVPSGTGILIAGGNDNVIRNNWIWDNWRHGAQLFFVEAYFRGDSDPLKQFDTSNGNRYTGNRMGVRPDGVRDPNGQNFWWDEGGRGNCWEGNTGPGGRPANDGDPAQLPPCPGSPVNRPADPVKHASIAPCALHDEQDNPDPVGCPWNTVPPEPK